MRRLDQRQRLDQPLPPGLGAVAEQALHLAERLPALALRLRRHQVGEAFHRGEIELAVLEGAAGELAGLGRAQALDASRARPAPRRSPRGRRATAARPRPRRSRYAARETTATSASSMMSPLAGSRMRASAAWRGAGILPVSGFERLAGARPGNAHDRNRRRPAAGGEGEDGVACWLRHRGAGERRGEGGSRGTSRSDAVLNLPSAKAC